MALFEGDKNEFKEQATNMLKEELAKQNIILMNTNFLNDVVIDIGELYAQYLSENEIIFI